jgi:hypothetical protein
VDKAGDKETVYFLLVTVIPINLEVFPPHSINIVAYKPVARQRPRNKQLYDGYY